jgi:hypothetical protein
MSAFASPDAAAINKAGVIAFEASGLVETLKTNMASTSAETAIEVSDRRLECIPDAILLNAVLRIFCFVCEGP